MSRVRDITKFLEETRKTNTDLKALRPSTTSTIDSAAVLVMKSASGMSVFSTLDSLPVTSLTTGQQAYVTENSRIYVSNGNGWYNVAVVNATPSLTLSSSGTIALTAGAATTITMTATDSDNDNANLVLSLESGGDLFKFATVSQDSSVVTITPRTQDSATALGSDGSATLTFKASDGVNQATVQNTFTLSFGPDWTASYTESKLLASDKDDHDYFGRSVTISADGAYAIVGAIFEDTNGASAGKAYIYVRSGSTWTQQQAIQPTDIQASDNFGTSCALNSDGSYAIISAPYEDTGGAMTGSVYIFTRSGSTWSQQAKIQAGDPGVEDFFGISVAINSDATYIAVGSPGDNGTATYDNRGAVYTFTRSGSTWTQQQKIQHSDSVYNDQFGWSVSMNSDATYIAAGAKTHTGFDYGKGYIFTRSGSTWSQQASIQSSDVQSNDNFGHSISISDDGAYIVAGAYHEDTGGSIAGAAYIFVRSGTSWSQQQKIQSSDIQANDYFGWSSCISRDGNHVIVSAHYEGTGGGEAGAAYIFKRDGTTWSQIKKLQAADKASGDYFGVSVYLSTDATFAICGAHYASDSPKSYNGSTYIFESG